MMCPKCKRHFNGKTAKTFIEKNGKCRVCAGLLHGNLDRCGKLQESIT